MPRYWITSALQEVGDGKVDIVAAEQVVIAHGDAPDVGNRGLVAQAQFENAEIRGAATDIDDQHMPQPRIALVGPLPQLSRFVTFEPAIKRSLRLFEQSHIVGEACFFGGGNRQPLCRRIEGSGNRNRDLLIIERTSGLLARSIWHAPTYVLLSISSRNHPRSSCHRGHVIALG